MAPCVKRAFARVNWVCGDAGGDMNDPFGLFGGARRRREAIAVIELSCVDKFIRMN